MEIEGNGHLPFLDIDIYKKKDGSLGHKFTVNPPILTYTCINSPTTTQPTNTRSSPPKFTELAPSVTQIPSSRNWISSTPYLSRMGIMTAR